MPEETNPQKSHEQEQSIERWYTARIIGAIGLVALTISSCGRSCSDILVQEEITRQTEYKAERAKYEYQTEMLRNR